MYPKGKLLWLSVLLLLLEGCLWFSSDACLEDERIALLQLKPFFNSYHYLNNWVEDKASDCCQWNRVDCNSSSTRVIELDLNHTAGQVQIRDGWYLNASLFLPFKELKRLYLPDNGISGLVENEGLPKLSLEILDLSYNHFLNYDTMLSSLSHLSSLKHLYLVGNSFTGSNHGKAGFQWLSRLDHLETLDLSFNSFKNDILFHMGSLPSLKTLSLRCNKLKGMVHLNELNNLTKLNNLDLSGNNIESIRSSNQAAENQTQLRLTNLEVFDLSNNVLKNSSFAFISSLSSLKSLNMAANQLQGSIDITGWCDLRNLKELDISWNAFEGTLPYCLGNLTSLRMLDISDNQFTGNLTPLANLNSLGCLSLSRNHFEISMSFFSSLANLSNLKILYADENKLVMEPNSQHTSVPKLQLYLIRLSSCTTDDELGVEPPKLLYYQNELRYVDLSYSSFNGTVPLWLLENNTKLEDLFLMGNSFTGSLLLPHLLNPNFSAIDISENKLQGPIPANICSSFPNLEWLSLSKNAFEGNIPHSLSGMNALYRLDLSNNQLSGEVPEELFKSSSLHFLRLSNNNLSGKIVSTIFTSSMLLTLYLDGNKFSGEVPDINLSSAGFRYSSLYDINLNNNSLHGNLPRWIGNVPFLMTLALSNNQFEGSIPMEWCNLYQLQFLELSQNNLSGSIPSCFNRTNYLKHVHLNGNRLSGPLTLAFYNSSSLVTLDLSGNKLTGNIQSWIATLSSLSVLNLKANHLHGQIPVQLCRMYSLSIIDLSQNMFSGSIPSCLGNLTLAPKDEKSYVPNFWHGTPESRDVSTYMEKMTLGRNYYSDYHTYTESFMEEWIDFTTKSASRSYGGNILDFMSGIDLSCNNLTGHIPYELGNLTQIYSLNLSHNNLMGVIPSPFSKLEQIESLDLSYNNLSGTIPAQLVELDNLEVFSVSHNNLSGTTPERKAQFGTFEESSYEGNPLLCGPPLLNSCSGTESPPSTMPTTSDDEGEDSFMDAYVFYVTFVVSYAIALLGVFLALYINPYWRRTWFSLVEGCITTCRYSTVGTFVELYIFRRCA